MQRLQTQRKAQKVDKETWIDMRYEGTCLSLSGEAAVGQYVIFHLSYNPSCVSTVSDQVPPFRMSRWQLLSSSCLPF